MKAIARLAPSGPEDFAEVLSLHFLKAQRFGEAWAFSRIAGDRAKEKYANSDAAMFYERAVEAARKVGAEPRELASIYESLGDVKWTVGAYADTGAAYTAARRLLSDDPPREALLIEKLARIPYRGGRYAEAVRWINRGLKQRGWTVSGAYALVEDNGRAWAEHNDVPDFNVAILGLRKSVQAGVCGRASRRHLVNQNAVWDRQFNLIL